MPSYYRYGLADVVIISIGAEAGDPFWASSWDIRHHSTLPTDLNLATYPTRNVPCFHPDRDVQVINLVFLINYTATR